ncbi:MAG: hypothetical protein GC204_10220 [Chloroflexi bacterium]|nr:hypothetical protein [Chloroflexota bacterium]
MAEQQNPTPNPDLKSLEPLIGTWKVSGEAQGQIRFEWTEGGFFLVQHVDFVQNGKPIKGMEIIGHRQGVDRNPSPDIQSRFYSLFDGLTLDYTYELVGDTLRIWFGDRSSDNWFEGKFDADGNSFSGAWQWPGGGYSVSGTRIA